MEPVTGRKHQLRKHVAALWKGAGGVLGDDLYPLHAGAPAAEPASSRRSAGGAVGAAARSGSSKAGTGAAAALASALDAQRKAWGAYAAKLLAAASGSSPSPMAAGASGSRPKVMLHAWRLAIDISMFAAGSTAPLHRHARPGVRPAPPTDTGVGPARGDQRDAVDPLVSVALPPQRTVVITDRLPPLFERLAAATGLPPLGDGSDAEGGLLQRMLAAGGHLKLS